MSGFFCNFCAFRFCFENHISFLQSCAFGFAVIREDKCLFYIKIMRFSFKMECFHPYSNSKSHCMHLRLHMYLFSYPYFQLADN